MNYYIDIHFLPHSDFPDTTLMDMLFSYLHKQLVKIGWGEIGISFPNFSRTLGNLLRLHGKESSLQQLMSTPWMRDLIDYLKISNINPIPEKVSYRVVKRVQVKSCNERLYRRSIRKGWLTEEEMNLKISDCKVKRSSLPFLKVRSLSTGQIFLLFIEHGQILTSPTQGTFTAYGLSSNATIPWF
jgi:CRISPR-associated endonuclease Csy4